MRILVTAGNTFAPIDRVRGITNIFTGRTGAQIALNAEVFGHDVTLLTSHPQAEPNAAGLRSVRTFHTFDDLEKLIVPFKRQLYRAVVEEFRSLV